MSSVLNTTTQPTQETKIALMEEQIAQFVEKMAAKNAEIEELKKNKSSHKIRKLKKLKKISQLSKKEIKRKLTYFKKKRKAQYKFAMKVLDKIVNGERNGKKKHIVCCAEEKSGKRGISEIINLKLRFTMMSKKPKDLLLKKAMKNVYIDGLHVCGLVRKSCEPQYEELRKLGIYAEAVGRVNDSIDYLDDFNSKKGEKTGIIILDELDYASAINSKMEPFIKEENSHIIAMSSTPWDATKSGWYHVIMKFEPAAEYCGGKWFVQQELVIKPTPFITDKLEFSEQAKTIIPNCGKKRNVVVVRLPTSGKGVTYRSYKAKRNGGDAPLLLEAIHIKESFIDSSAGKTIGETIKLAKVDFDEEVKKKDCSMVHIIYICGKYTRSTELLPYVKSSLYAWHDSRMLKDKSCLQALSQALGRIKHYKSAEYPNGHPIFMYADPRALEYWDNPEQNEKTMGNLSSRTKSSKVRDTSDIKSMDFDTFDEAKKFKLKKLHSETFDASFKERSREGKNGEAVTPAAAPDGRIMNNIRGIWKILDVSNENNKKNGISGAGATYDGGARLLVGYDGDGTVPTYIVVWKEEGSVSEEKQTIYNHKPSKKNAYN
jgi:hypothetical protein|tara:strand:+ start:1123 stop:2925 length:1803 start_codon:yes stop_codon:yes gene_type:complete